MKVLSVIIPCFNSGEYMLRSIKSALCDPERTEVIIVDDGSSDDTLKKGRELEKKYPGTVRCIHQENKGHGGAVNTGIENATGAYIKVLDSDDRLLASTMIKVLDLLEYVIKNGKELDMLITNFVYDKQGVRHKKVMAYRGALPKGRIFGWDETKFALGQYLLMHSVTYRRSVLTESGLKLPEHTFYVDNIYVFQPLAHVKTMYYLNDVFYMYYIGREDQSVNESVMVKRIDQQVRVNKEMIDIYTASDFGGDLNVEKAMRHYLDIVTCITSAISLLGDEETLKKREEVWDYMKEKNPGLFKMLRHSFVGTCMNLPGKAGRRVSGFLYRAADKIVGFN